MFGRLCGLGVGLGCRCGRGGGIIICYALAERQLNYFKTPVWQLKGAILATVVEGRQLDLATVVASSLLNADSQSLHLKAPGWDVGQSNNLLADVKSQSVKQVSGLLQLANVTSHVIVYIVE